MPSDDDEDDDVDQDDNGNDENEDKMSTLETVMTNMLMRNGVNDKSRLAAHNQLGILWCQRDDMVKVETSHLASYSISSIIMMIRCFLPLFSLNQARQHLEKALNIYFNFRQAANQQDLVLLHQLLFPEEEAPRDSERNVKEEEDPEKHVELLVTHTYYFLAQVVRIKKVTDI